MFPSNEQETIALFKLASARLGWHLTHLQTAFPDAVIENGRGQRLVVEFEFDSKNFRAHKHDPAGCDLIIAYTDSWENPPVPVWALEGCAEQENMNIRCLLSKYIPKRDLSWLYFQIEMLQGKVRQRDSEISRLNNIDKWFYKISGDGACLIMACGFFLWGLYRLLEWLSKVF